MKLSFRNPFLIVGVFVVLAGIGVAVYFFSIYSVPSTTEVEPEKNQQVNNIQNGCLGNDEIAEYQLIDEKRAEDSVVIIVKDKNTGDERRQFTVPLSSATHYHPLEVRKCGVYVVRRFNYDYEKGKILLDYRTELWRYDFQSNGKLLMALNKSPEGRFVTDFRIDPHERYLVLEKGFAGSSDGVYDIVFKDLKTMEDVFVLPVSEVWERNPYTIPGSSVGFFEGWTRDGRYFWGDFFGGAPVFAYIRIDTEDWSYEVFPAPPDVLGGDKLNIETGWLTVHPGNAWFGISELHNEEVEKRRKEGINTELYIYNLITEERRLVTQTDEPLWYFKPKWLSDTELQYKLPSGEIEVYEVQ